MEKSCLANVFWNWNIDLIVIERKSTLESIRYPASRYPRVNPITRIVNFGDCILINSSQHWLRVICVC